MSDADEQLVWETELKDALREKKLLEMESRKKAFHEARRREREVANN